MRLLGIPEIQNITLGASVLASGGGGDPYIGSIMAIDAVKRHGPISLLSVDELDDDAYFVAVGMIGAPTVLIEKLLNGNEVMQACAALERHCGKKIAGIFPIEAGGLNSLLPLATAARLGLPIIDMDGIGRAFPELQMNTFNINHINFSPMALVDEKGNQVIIDTLNSLTTERFARAICARMGGAGIFAGCLITGAQARSSSIRDILTIEQNIGEAMSSATSHGTHAISEVLSLLNGHQLFHGKVVEVHRRTEGAFSRGIAVLEGLEGNQNARFEVQFQNEYLLAKIDGEPCCMTPDLISLLDDETGVPILAERLRYGARIKAVGIPAHELWRTERGLELAGPGYFKYDTQYIPVEALAQARGGT